MVNILCEDNCFNVPVQINMKNATTLKSSTNDSPKTPGGISKTLLTPCRRVGLSRNFRKSGALPFQSPLSSNTEVKQEEVKTRKRKESLDECSQKLETIGSSNATLHTTQTPTRNVEMPRRKKSKTLLATLNKTAAENESQTIKNTNIPEEKILNKQSSKELNDDVQNGTISNVSTPVRLKSKSGSKTKITPSKSVTKDVSVSNTEKENLVKIIPEESKRNTAEIRNKVDTKEKSPNNLTKECIVVIQKKIFKKELNNKLKTPKPKSDPDDAIKSKNIVSQTVFDSDSDDVPLININKENVKISAQPNTIEDDDFAIKKINKLNNAIPLKSASTKSPTIKTKKISKVNVEVHKPTISQSSAEDDDFFEKKHTILVRKSYDKVLKPQKAKSTGSITQKDIDDLKAKIEKKKKLLLARAMSEDTKELRDLIKKWQKGCQDALMELMDLMKSKMPDKQNMDYSEMLQTLKIPASLVGYDSDNDCFLTPEDQNIILANVKD